MRTRTTAVRILAVAGSIVLVGGYVWYRAQAALQVEGAPKVETVGAKNDVLLPGSKSAEIFPAPAVQAEQQATEKPRTVMGGSKSAAVASPDRPPFADPKLIPDSKSTPITNPNGAPLVAPQRQTGPRRH